MKVYLIRHWETHHNANWIIQGHVDWKLNDNWLDQARRIWKRLATEDLDVIFTSPLSRASDTAKEIFSYHPDVELKEVDELMERTFWEYDDVSKDSIVEKNWELWMSLFEFAIRWKGAETDQECYDRAQKILFLIAHLQVESVCIVTHWWFARFIHWAFLWMWLQQIQDEFVIIENASLTTYEWKWNNWNVTLFNDTSHMN